MMGMYSRGMTTSDICEQVKEIYGVDVSEGTISNVTNHIVEHVKEWQDRPLESINITVWMDGICKGKAKREVYQQVHIDSYRP